MSHLLRSRAVPASEHILPRPHLAAELAPLANRRLHLGVLHAVCCLLFATRKLAPMLRDLPGASDLIWLPLNAEDDGRFAKMYANHVDFIRLACEPLLAAQETANAAADDGADGSEGSSDNGGPEANDALDDVDEDEDAWVGGGPRHGTGDWDDEDDDFFDDMDDWDDDDDDFDVWQDDAAVAGQTSVQRADIRLSDVPPEVTVYGAASVPGEKPGVYDEAKREVMQEPAPIVIDSTTRDEGQGEEEIRNTPFHLRVPAGGHLKVRVTLEAAEAEKGLSEAEMRRLLNKEEDTPDGERKPQGPSGEKDSKPQWFSEWTVQMDVRWTLSGEGKGAFALMSTIEEIDVSSVPFLVQLRDGKILDAHTKDEGVNHAEHMQGPVHPQGQVRVIHPSEQPQVEQQLQQDQQQQQEQQEEEAEADEDEEDLDPEARERRIQSRLQTAAKESQEFRRVTVTGSKKASCLCVYVDGRMIAQKQVAFGASGYPNLQKSGFRIFASYEPELRLQHAADVRMIVVHSTAMTQQEVYRDSKTVNQDLPNIPEVLRERRVRNEVRTQGDS